MSRGFRFALQEEPHRGPGAKTFVELGRILGRDRRAIGQAHAQRFDRRGHRVGRIHAAAGAGARAGVPHDLLPVGVIDRAAQVLPVALKGRNDIERFVMPVSGADRTAVNHQCRTIHPPHRHQTAGHVLVAAGERHQPVVPLGAHDGLDRVGDQIARLQRVAHSLGAHRDAVADADRVESHTDQVGGDHPLLDPGGQLVQVHVARVPLVPHTGDADLGFLHVGLGQPGPVKHGLAGPLAAGLGDAGTELVKRPGHLTVLLATGQRALRRRLGLAPGIWTCNRSMGTILPAVCAGVQCPRQAYAYARG